MENTQDSTRLSVSICSDKCSIELTNTSLFIRRFKIVRSFGRSTRSPPHVALKQEGHVILRGPAHRSASLILSSVGVVHTPHFLPFFPTLPTPLLLPIYFFSDAIAVELLHGAPSPTKRGAAGVVAAARDAIAMAVPFAMAERDGTEHRRYYDRGPWPASSQARAAMAYELEACYLQLQICFHVCFCWNQCTNLLSPSLFFAGTKPNFAAMSFCWNHFVPLFCYTSFGFLLLPALSFVTSFFMRLSRPCACVFCYNLVPFLLQPCAFFATTREAPSLTTSYFCSNRFVVCCNQCQFLLSPASLIFLEPALDFFIFATTSVSICWNKLQFLLPSGFWFVGTALIFSNFAASVLLVFARTVKNFCYDRWNFLLRPAN